MCEASLVGKVDTGFVTRAAVLCLLCSYYGLGTEGVGETGGGGGGHRETKPEASEG